MDHMSFFETKLNYLVDVDELVLLLVDVLEVLDVLVFITKRKCENHTRKKQKKTYVNVTDEVVVVSVLKNRQKLFDSIIVIF